ncbi:MAG: cyclic nucleotide-binding domain-containing protein [Rhodospirillales bacterium]|nr:cyclic nucleotide-binding domain-containing protein [Rhodospirillales bacterium]
MLGPFSEGGLWSLDRNLEAVTLAAWDILPGLLPEFATLLLIAAIAFLLQASAIEIATRSDIELNRELRVTGIANLLAGLGGGLPGYHSMSGSVLTYRLGMPIRFVGLATAAICVAALIFGSTALECLPRLAVGVILFFMGTGFLVEALGRNLIRMDRSEAGVTLLVFPVIVFAGFMAGIGVGVAAALVIFVVNYARVPVVSSALTAETYHSNVERAPAYAQIIRSAGRSVLVLKLQGYVFFGTSNRLVDLVRERFDQAPSLRFLLLDFRTVNGIDSSATASFEKLKRYAEERGFWIIYVSVQERIAEVLRRAQVYESTRPLIRAFTDADRGLEWIEDQILVAGGIAVESQNSVIAEQLSQIFPDANEAREFQSRLEAFDHCQGDIMVRQGAASDHLLIVESGRVTIALELPSGGTVRLRTMGPGTVVGEIAFYLGTPRSASVIAEADTLVYRLTRQALLDLQTSRPHVAIHFQEAMARLLAGRIVETNRLLAELNS